MRRLLNKTISRLKGHSYQIDPAIPSYYLFNIVVRRLTMAIRGSVSGVKKHGIIFISPDVIIRGKSKFHVGRGTTTDRGCYIDAMSLEGITFGNNVSVGKYTTIECTGSITNIGKGLKVGHNVGMGTHGLWGCAGGICIGDDTIIGNYVSFHSENHNYKIPNILIRRQGVNRKGIIVGQNCWIGAKTTFLDGAQVGNGCIIAAGAVVHGIFPDNVIIGGVPAKILKYRNSYNQE